MKHAPLPATAEQSPSPIVVESLALTSVRLATIRGDETLGDMRGDVMCGDNMRGDDMFGCTSWSAAKLRSALVSGVAKATRGGVTLRLWYLDESDQLYPPLVLSASPGSDAEKIGSGSGVGGGSEFRRKRDSGKAAGIPRRVVPS